MIIVLPTKITVRDNTGLLQKIKVNSVYKKSGNKIQKGVVIDITDD